MEIKKIFKNISNFLIKRFIEFLGLFISILSGHILEFNEYLVPVARDPLLPSSSSLQVLLLSLRESFSGTSSVKYAYMFQTINSFFFISNSK